ncbi:MAG TPA: DUF1634 domain-containing protein [Candidatus Acidoferrales bacterium]|nr:DUF1634 domain-containing protein [Candidatus Acidoferrales bacterium]
MAQAYNQWNDERMDQIISVLLRTGVLLASAVVFIGGVLYLIHHQGPRHEYHTFRAEPPDYRTFRGILEGLLSIEGRNWIQFGLVLLVATPMARVAFSVFAFFEERDWLYVFLTLIVLSVLVLSLFRH